MDNCRYHHTLLSLGILIALYQHSAAEPTLSKNLGWYNGWSISMVVKVNPTNLIQNCCPFCFFLPSSLSLLFLSSVSSWSFPYYKRKARLSIKLKQRRCPEGPVQTLVMIAMSTAFLNKEVSQMQMLWPCELRFYNHDTHKPTHKIWIETLEKINILLKLT